MRHAALVVLLVLSALGPIDTRAEAPKERDIELKNGEIISAALRSVKESGIEIELDGIPMQLTWDLLRAERFLDDRKDLIDEQKVDSWQSFARWCRDNALDEEFTAANTRIRELGGMPIDAGVVQKPEQQDPVQPVAPVEPEPTQPTEPGKRAASVSLTFSDDDEFTKALKDAFKEFKIPLKTSGAEAIVSISDFDLDEVNHATFFGETISAKYRATCTVSFTDAAGKELSPAKGFDSGDKQANSVESAKTQARTTMARAIANWLSVRVKSGE